MSDFRLAFIGLSTYLDSRLSTLGLSTRYNRPFPSSKSEAKCEAIDMKMIFNYDANKTHFHKKGFALSLVLKVRFLGTRKWPITYSYSRSVLSAEPKAVADNT